MQLENLEVLLAINKHGSLRKAADALLTSYQNVSRILHQIEEEFGVPLFVRSSTGMSPTDEGKLAVITARQMLNLYNDMLDQFEYRSLRRDDEVDHKMSGTLEIACSIITSNGFLNDFLVEFSSRYPNVAIKLNEDDAYLEHDPTDTDCHIFVFPRTEKDLDQSDTYTIPLMKDNICLLISKDSPFNTRKTITLKQVVNMPLVLISKIAFERTILASVLRDHKQLPKRPFYTNSLIGYQKIVAAGNHAGLSTDILSSKLISDYPTTFEKIAIRDKGLTIHHCLLLSNPDTLTPVEKTFVKEIREAFHI